MKTLLTILLLGLVAAAWADTDVDNTYFNPAASSYIHGDSASASNLVAKGLALFPDDGKLKRLKELLEQQQNQNEQNQNEQNKEQQDQQNQDPQQNDPQQDQADQQDQEPQDQDQEEQQDQADQQQPPEPQRAEQMSQDEAERLLDAMKQEEKNKRLELHPVMGRPVKVDKDW